MKLSVDNECISESNRLLANYYLNSLKARQKADMTIDIYRYYIERFLVEVQKDVRNLTPEDVHDWLVTNFGNRKATTYHVAYFSIYTFFKHLISEDILQRNLKERWKRKIDRTTPKYLTDSEIARLVLCIEKMSVRNRAIIQFLISSGCRRSELSRLNWSDIDIDKGEAIVTGKGGDIRIASFDETAIISLINLKKKAKSTSGAVFVNKFGGRLSPPGIYEVVRKAGRETGIHLFTHRIRHSYATTLLNKGSSIEEIADDLGHKYVETTQIYASILDETLIKTYRQYKE